MQPEPADRAGVRRHRREGRADRPAQRLARPAADACWSGRSPRSKRPCPPALTARSCWSRARTRLEELIAKYHTLAQARFYVEHLGADFADYEREHETYRRSGAAPSQIAGGMGPLPGHRPRLPAQLPVRARRHRRRARPGRPGGQHDEVSRRPAAGRPQSGRRALRRRAAAVRQPHDLPAPAAPRSPPTGARFKAVTMAKARADRRPGAPCRQRPVHRPAHAHFGASTRSRSARRTRRSRRAASSSRPASARPRGSRASSPARSPSPARSAGRPRRAYSAQAWDCDRAALRGARAVSEPHLAGQLVLRRTRQDRTAQRCAR